MLKVSIHAPARGATGRPPGRAYLCSVSIHAPARGATCPRGIIYPLRPRFNSRTREGCDRAGTEETEEYRQFQFTHPRGVRPLLSLSSLSLSLVSIHAPARGATFAQPRRPLQPHVSIHAPARGATPRLVSRSGRRTRFNSRTREGCDRRPLSLVVHAVCFNSRTREGCGLSYNNGNSGLIVSIHAPARGATSLLTISADSSMFQFTHPRGVRLQGWGGGCGAASTDLLLRRYSNYPFCPVLLAPKIL